MRDERLGQASDLQKFLQNLDHFQQWLTHTETAIASEDIPNELGEAERLLAEHAQLKEEINAYADDYAQMKEYGQKVVEGQEGVQYMFLREASESPAPLHFPLFSVFPFFFWEVCFLYSVSFLFFRWVVFFPFLSPSFLFLSTLVVFPKFCFFPFFSGGIFSLFCVLPFFLWKCFSLF